MPKQIFLSRFSLIIQRLEKCPATFEEIESYLSYMSNLGEEDFTISKRTFQRDIKDIYKQLGIEIKNERKGDNHYYIEEDDNDFQTNKRILDGFQINNAISILKNNNNVVFLEQRKPNGIEHFRNLLIAINSKQVVKFSHKKYYEEVVTERTVHPLALKESLGRWYLLAVDLKDDNLKTFGLDRIDNVNVLKSKFKIKYEYDYQVLFKNSFGVIYLLGTEPNIVQLSFNYEQGMYVKNYPLHQSQKIVKETREQIIYEYEIFTTYDFIMEILKFGNEVKVLQPLSLIKEIKSILSKNLKQYE